MKKLFALTTTVLAVLVVCVCAFAHDKQHHDCSHNNHPEKYVCKRCNGSGTDPLTYTCSSCNGERSTTRMSKCSSCRGTGKVKDRYGDDVTCSTCDGTGHIINKQTCSKCRGTGDEKRPCRTCGGSGYVDR